MKKSDVFPSNYIKADDLDGDVTYTIASVKIETLGQGKDAEKKPVVFFEEVEKGMVLNVTNWNTIESQHGSDSDDWIGKRIIIFATEVEFKGEMVMGIRVRLRAPKPAARQQAEPAAGEPAPAKPTATAAIAKRKAWAAFKASALPGTSDEAITEEWHTAIEGFRPGVAETDWTAEDWQKFVAAEFQTTPF
jgi:hypothetical protein